MSHAFDRFGGDLLSHVLGRSTIGAAALNGRVRDGIGCFARARATKPAKRMGDGPRRDIRRGFRLTRKARRRAASGRALSEPFHEMSFQVLLVFGVGSKTSVLWEGVRVNPSSSGSESSLSGD